MRRLMVLALLAAVAVPAAAQVGPRRGRDTAVVRSRGFDYYYGPEGIRVESFQRGRLGILVDLTADPARDSIGARVAGVTPGGPAEKAGVQPGDLVVRLNGTPLVRGRAPAQDDDGAVSRPGTRLIELASRLDPGDTVHLDLKRGGRPMSVTLVAQESGADEVARRFDFALPRHDAGRMDLRIPGGMTGFVFGGGPLANMELVQVNPGLSEYFGTADGLLVVNVGNDSTLGLRSGDVILSIGGRKPGSPAHAMRILNTYDPNETVTFEIMRMKRRVTVSGKMPQEPRRGWTISPNSLEDGAPMRWPRAWGGIPALPRMLLRLPMVPGLPGPASVRVET
jgi:membrane-associated protease RseP (regulator of RpoE activity)